MFERLKLNLWYLFKISSKSSIFLFFGALGYLLFFMLFFFLIPERKYSCDVEFLHNIVRIITVMLPISIAIFTFAYKETKEAAYINLETSNIILPFVLVNTSSILTLAGSLFLLWKEPPQSNNHFIFIIIHTALNILLFIWYFYILINNMDVKKTLKKSLEQTLKMENILYINLRKQIISPKRTLNVLKHFSSYNERNFHLFNKLLKRGHFIINGEIKRNLLSINKNFNSHFITNSDTDIIIKFYNKNPRSVQKVGKIYNHILLNYRIIIRGAIDNKLTVLEYELINDMFKLSPLHIIDTHNEKTGNSLNKLAEEIIKHFFTANFELIVELSNEDTVEFSYLLDRIYNSSSEIIAIKKTMQVSKQKSIIKYYYKEFLNLLEAITIWSMESKKIHLLTESINIILLISNSLKNKTTITDNAQTLRSSLSNDFLDEIEKTFNIKFDKKNFQPIKQKNNERFTKNDYKHNLIEKDLLDIIYKALLKSIELSYYGSTGYLLKILVSYFQTNIINQFTKDFYNNMVKKTEATFDLRYFHYTINKSSKKYCLNKMIVLISNQILYRKNDTQTHKLLSNNIEEKDFIYILKKLKNAGKAYGLLSINHHTLSKTKKYYYYYRIHTT